MSNAVQPPSGTEGGPADHAKNEHFIYLGKHAAAPVLFFIHVVYVKRESELVVRMAGDVYNCLIHHRCLKRDESIVVYNMYFEPPAGTPHVHPVYVCHASFRTTIFPDGVLSRMLHRLFTVPRPPDEETLIVSAVFEEGTPRHYDARIVPGGVLGASIAEAAVMLPEDTPLAPLQTMLSTKSVDYLGI